MCGRGAVQFPKLIWSMSQSQGTICNNCFSVSIFSWNFNSNIQTWNVSFFCVDRRAALLWLSSSIMAGCWDNAHWARGRLKQSRSKCLRVCVFDKIGAVRLRNSMPAVYGTAAVCNFYKPGCYLNWNRFCEATKSRKEPEEASKADNGIVGSHAVFKRSDISRVFPQLFRFWQRLGRISDGFWLLQNIKPIGILSALAESQHYGG